MGGGVSGVSGNQQTYETQKKSEKPTSVETTAQDGVSVFTSSLIEGKGIDGALEATNQLIQKSIKGALKSAAGKFLEMLLGGNDSAAASKDSAKTAANIGKGTKTLTMLQSKLIDANLAALDQLVSNGSIDLQDYAANLTQIAVQVGTQGEEATAFTEEQKKLDEERQQIYEQLSTLCKQNGIELPKPEDMMEEITVKDKDGNETVIKAKKSDKSEGDSSVNSQIANLLKQYNDKSGEIAALGEQITATTQMQQKVSESLAQGVSDVVVRGENLGNVVTNQAATFIKEGVSEVTNAMLEQVGLLQGDAVTGYTNAAIDSGAAAAAPGLAAAETAGTFGLGAGHASTILANGVADGVAAGLRSATGSSAVGGIAAALAGGKGLSEAISTTLANEAQNWIDSQVDQLANSLAEGLTGQKEGIDTSKEELTEQNLVKEDKPQMA